MVKSMIENRELTMDDYLAMVRRRLKIILIPALLAPIAGLLVSYAFPPKYNSQSLVLVEGQKVPPRSLVMGSPGKVKRLLTQSELAGIQQLADRYVSYRLDYQ